ncbi:MAG: nucleotidyl transferase AbiEii/AbiGii toxin family protein, partial [Actinobacteria bacterium]|nr:nucleotidyl transferase AbiEii/AbiGii toxin family protein [Actinomycetota bacterium]
MNKQLVESLQKSLGISQEQIVREEYEMIILKQLFESELGKSFVFKGGTALRLAYGSQRFSEDLDFSVVEDFDKNKLDSLLKRVADQYETLKLIETIQKKYT